VVEDTHKVLKLLGVDERYLYLKWVSASEGPIFAEEIRGFTQRLRQLGRNPLAETNGSVASAA
jgi:F420-non-reducing hydrogenase iron-sulfur subunit